jgi:hypothetical protein
VQQSSAPFERILGQGGEHAGVREEAGHGNGEHDPSIVACPVFALAVAGAMLAIGSTHARSPSFQTFAVPTAARRIIGTNGDW